MVQRGGVSRIESAGLPLGMFCEVSFSKTTFRLQPSDMLFLYTDGLSEARRAGEEYGVDRVTNLLRQGQGQHPNEVIAACLRDLHSFADSPLLDDITVLAIQRMA